MRSVIALAAWAALKALPNALGHGYMTFPKPRNAHFTKNCAQCANGPGPCGELPNSQWTSDSSVSDTLGPYFPNERTELKAGGIIEVQIGITAVHNGLFEIQLCKNPGNKITHECFEPLKRDPTDTEISPYIPEHPTFYYFLSNECMATTNPQSSGNKQLKARFLVPSGLNLEHAVLRWVWQTGNSCVPNTAVEEQLRAKNWKVPFNGRQCTLGLATKGMSPCNSGGSCPGKGCAGEYFYNCADVRVSPGSGTVSKDNHNIATGSTGGGSGGGSGGNSSTTQKPTTKPTTTTARPTAESTGSASSKPTTTVPTTGQTESPGGGGGAGCLSRQSVSSCQSKVRGIQGPHHDEHCRQRCELVADPQQALHQHCKIIGVCDLAECVSKLDPACTA